MKPTILLLALSSALVTARESPALPADPHFEPYQLLAAPPAGPLMLEEGDFLAICGDSITQQKRYSLIMETYLTACMPELKVTCRQFGWSGEKADGFVHRMANDVLRFKPDVATTCYGMNDFRYVPYDQSIADDYVNNQRTMIHEFREAGCTVLLGSPGIIDTVPHWVETASGTKQDLNVALSRFRNLGLVLAAEENVRFADLFTPMLIADWRAKTQFGESFLVAGDDGVHPGWAGQVIMAYSFLKGLGLDGDLGAVTLSGDSAIATGGHQVKSYADGKITLVSSRFPFSAGPGEPGDDDSIRAGLALVPFDADLNRITLRLSQTSAPKYSITWGSETREYSADQLKEGVNLAADFVTHPLLDPFRNVWKAAENKQNYETRQMKDLMHGPEARVDMEGIVAITEKVHRQLAAELKKAMTPVEHVIEVRPLN